MCGKGCRCQSCYNNEDKKKIRELVIQDLKKLNPFAFKPKFKKLSKKNKDLHARGCTCKKSKCIKKYCECYNEGVGCSEICKCVDCQNSKLHIDQVEKEFI